MAETTTQTTVLNIDTSNSVKSVKDLKNQIKDLKDKIVQMTAAGEDCSAEYAELGTTMRQYKDITEQAQRASNDLGDQLAVVSGSVKGVAGAVSAVTGVLGLMGGESEKTTKLLKTMASAMSITAGIQAMESGFKSIKQLASGFVVATKGAKSFGAALKAIFASNPIGLLLVGLTTAITLFSQFKSKQAEAAESLKKKQEEAAEFMKQKWQNAIGEVEARFSRFFNSSLDWTNFWNLNEFQKDVEQIEGDTGAMYRELSKQIDDFKKQADEATQNNSAWKFTEEGEKAYKQYYANLRKMAALHYKDIENETNDEAKQIKANLRQQYGTASLEEKKYNDELKKERQKNASDRSKAAQDNAKKQLESDKKAATDLLKLQQATAQRLFELDKETATNKLRNGEMTTEDYNATMLQLETNYYDESQKQLQNYIEKMQGLQNKYANNNLLSKQDKAGIFTETELQQSLQQIDELRRKANDAKFEYKQNTAASLIDRNELENAIDIQKQINQIERESFTERLAIEAKYTADSHNIFAAYHRQQIELMDEEAEHENKLYNAFLIENANKQTTLQESYANGLITQAEYMEGQSNLNNELESRTLEHEQRLVDIKRQKTDEKKAIDENYKEFEKAMVSGVSNILNSLADAMGEQNENYKGLKSAATLIDTLQGSIAAMVGSIETFGMPYGAIVGGIAAAGVIAQGVATIRKINSVNPKGGNTSATSSSVQTFTTPQTATIATGATNDYTDMMGNAVADATQNNRVYVVLNDINDAEDRRVSVVNSNTF